MVLLIIGMAGAFGWLMAYLRVAQMTVDLMGAISQDPLTILLMINVMLLVLGTFMDMSPLIISPPRSFCWWSPPSVSIRSTATSSVILNLGIGLNTPPLGPGAVRRRRRRQDHYLGGDALDLAVLRGRAPRAPSRHHVPAISLWLPNLFK